MGVAVAAGVGVVEGSGVATGVGLSVGDGSSVVEGVAVGLGKGVSVGVAVAVGDGVGVGGSVFAGTGAPVGAAAGTGVLVSVGTGVTAGIVLEVAVTAPGLGCCWQPKARVTTNTRVPARIRELKTWIPPILLTFNAIQFLVREPGQPGTPPRLPPYLPTPQLQQSPAPRSTA